MIDVGNCLLDENGNDMLFRRAVARHKRNARHQEG